MSHFSLPRFTRVLQNDALQIARTLLHGTVTVLAITVLLYLARFARANPADDPAHIMVFGMCLIGAGLLLTGVAFRDLHHPLQRTRYLMLPCSNLERLLSRYLLTGPLFALYGALVFMAVDFISNQLTDLWLHRQQLAFSPFADESLAVIKGYLVAHLVLFIGAICFRSHALLNTIGVLVLALFGLFLFENVLERVFFPELYSWTHFDRVRQPPYDSSPWFAAHWLNVIALIGLFAWLMYIAYLCLRDHEATDGV